MTWVFWLVDFIVTFIVLCLINILQRKKYGKKLKVLEEKYAPIGSLIAHEDGYLYICFDDDKSKELAFNGEDGETFTFRFTDQRHRDIYN